MWGERKFPVHEDTEQSRGWVESNLGAVDGDGRLEARFLSCQREEAAFTLAFACVEVNLPFLAPGCNNGRRLIEQ